MGRTIKNINNDHRRVAYLRAQGKSHAEIAEETGFSEGHVKTILRNKEIQKLVEDESTYNSTTRSAKSVEEVVKRASLSAVNLLEQIINDSPTLGDHAPSMKNRFDAAAKILAIAGYSDKVQVNHNHTHALQGDMFARIQQRARELREDSVVEVEATPINEVKEIEHSL